MPQKKKLPLTVLEEAARVATQIALASFPVLPDRHRASLTVGTFWEGDFMRFELYLPQEAPHDALVLTEARVDVYDARVDSVRVFENAFKSVVSGLR